jgi:FHS family L-fucose permease-like MFS transporter
MTHEQAGKYTVLYWGGAMTGRFVGAWLLRWIPAGRLLAVVSIGALMLAGIAITSSGHLAMWCLIAVGLCHSIMFPTIFTLGIRGLGPLTEEGSGLLIMAIAGGALAELQGKLADQIGLQLSYLLPWACYLFILFYAVWGCRPTGALNDERLVS